MPSRPIRAARGLPIETGLPQSSMRAARLGRAEQRLEKLALAVPLQAADAEHLALAQREADAVAAGCRWRNC